MLRAKINNRFLLSLLSKLLSNSSIFHKKNNENGMLEDHYQGLLEQFRVHDIDFVILRGQATKQLSNAITLLSI